MNPIAKHIIRITALVVLASTLMSCAKRREPVLVPDASAVLSFLDGREVEYADSVITLYEDDLSELEIGDSDHRASGGGAAAITFKCEGDNGTYRVSGTLSYDITNGAMIGQNFEFSEIVEAE